MTRVVHHLRILAEAFNIILSAETVEQGVSHSLPVANLGGVELSTFKGLTPVAFGLQLLRLHVDLVLD